MTPIKTPSSRQASGRSTPARETPSDPSTSVIQADLDALFEDVYEEIKIVASGCLARERRDHTLQPTALVHEAYVKMRRQHRLGIHTKDRFVRVAVRVMRQILVDHARLKGAAKRGGGPAESRSRRLPLEEVQLTLDSTVVDALAVDEALRDLSVLDERKAAIVEMRIFGGLTLAEVAVILSVPRRTIERDWTFARCWLGSRLSEAPTKDPPQLADQPPGSRS